MSQPEHIVRRRVLREVERQYRALLKHPPYGEDSLNQAYRISIVRAYREMVSECAAGQTDSIRDLARVYETLLDYAPTSGGDGQPEAQVQCETVVAGNDTGVSPCLKHSAKSGRRLRGCYYTPDHIITYIVERTLGPIVRLLTSPEILTLKVLDPAMGSGLFLLSAAEFLSAAYGRALVREGKASRGAPEAEEFERRRRLITESCLYGVDVNPDAVEIAGLLLGCMAASAGTATGALSGHLKRGNSLLGAAPGEDPEAYEALYRRHVSKARVRQGSVGRRARGRRVDGGSEEAAGMFHWEKEFPEVFGDRDGRPRRQPGFDAVIGNPPYLSYSGRHRAPDRDGVSALSRSLGKASGWITSHGLFMIRALDLVRQGGLVSMIVPDQVGHLKGYGDLRRRMRREAHLVEVRYWGEDVFGDVTTPSMTFIVKRFRPGTSKWSLMIDRHGKRTRFRPGSEDEWHWSPARQVFENLAGRHKVLEGFSDPGVHTGNVADRLILERRRKGAVPVLEGRQVRAFRCSAPVRWLNRDYRGRAGEYFRVSAEATYAKTGIVLRQTADRPIAARHIHGCYFRNSVLALRVPDGFSIEYVLGILNSDAAAWLYKASAFESGQRAFPQVKVSRLKRIPIPDPALLPNRQLVQRIEEIVRALEGGEASPEAEDRLLQDLNRTVRDLYGLDAAMLDRIALVSDPQAKPVTTGVPTLHRTAAPFATG